MPNQQPLDPQCFDIAIIGAGIVGCAIARRFTLEGASVAIIEKASDILDGASKANIAILHTGFDAPQDSLEHQCIRLGHAEYNDIHTDLGLPLERCGTYVVAWNETEVEALQSILAQAHHNGVMDSEIITAKQLHRAEPTLSGNALAAIRIPGESIIDPWSAAYAYLGQALENGAMIFRNNTVASGEFDGRRWQIHTQHGHLDARTVINCAGLYGDQLDQKLLNSTSFNIHPRKGQFVVYDKAASSLIDSVILPVPSARTKGIVVFRSVFGNLIVGPTAEDQQSRRDTSTDEATLHMLMRAGETMLPGLKGMPVTAVYAGLRPATEHKDYQIHDPPKQNWISGGGPAGLSAATELKRHGVEIRSSTSVIDVQHGGVLSICDDTGPQMVTARRIVYACGIRETPRAARLISGARPQGVITTGNVHDNTD